ncbi:MAG: hypothetical protein KKD39_04290 [Candidatus Altiarchaeota archaeon]|nr:hypothetical protein [Candidatus Altiarchaeota archaeon]
MHYIRQFFTGNVEGWVHDFFTRYSKGEFLGPVCEVEVKKSIKFKGSVEYSNVFGEMVCLTGGVCKVEGAIFAKEDFRPTLEGLGIEFTDKSKVKQGFYVAEVKGEYPAEVLSGMYGKISFSQALLNLKCGSASLKCKKKPPKPGKEKDTEFISGDVPVDSWGKVREEVFFDVGEFTKARVENTLAIESLVIPAGMPPERARIEARRRGKVKRKVILDGVEKMSECVFEI